MQPINIFFEAYKKIIGSESKEKIKAVAYVMSELKKRSQFLSSRQENLSISIEKIVIKVATQ
jgi:hypothetical protein